VLGTDVCMGESDRRKESKDRSQRNHHGIRFGCQQNRSLSRQDARVHSARNRGRLGRHRTRSDRCLRSIGPGRLRQRQTKLWITFLVLLTITPLFRWRVTGVTGIAQLIATTVFLAVGVFALGAPFADLPGACRCYRRLFCPARH